MTFFLAMHPINHPLTQKNNERSCRQEPNSHATVGGGGCLNFLGLLT